MEVLVNGKRMTMFLKTTEKFSKTKRSKKISSLDNFNNFNTISLIIIRNTAPNHLVGCKLKCKENERGGFRKIPKNLNNGKNLSNYRNINIINFKMARKIASLFPLLVLLLVTRGTFVTFSVSCLPFFVLYVVVRKTAPNQFV